MSDFTSATSVLETKSKGNPPVDKRIDHDRYNCFWAVDGTTADKMFAVVYVRKDQTITTPGTIVFNYT